MWGQPQQQQQQPFFGGGGQQQQQPVFGQGGYGQQQQTTPGFGGMNPQGQQQQPQYQQNFSAASSFNKPNTMGSAGTYGQYGSQQQQSQQQTQNNAGAVTTPFYQSGHFEPNIWTHQYPYTSKQEVTEQAKNPGGQAQYGMFYNIRADPKFAVVSNQMLKVLDLMAMKQNQQQPLPSFEFIAGNEWQANKQNYVHVQKQTGEPPKPQGFGGNMGGNPQQQQQPSFGANNQAKPLFGGGMNQPSQFGQTPTPFGQQQQQQQPGIFGQQQPQQSSFLGGGLNKPAFGAATTFGGGNSSGIKPFGQTTTPAFEQTPMFGGANQQQQQQTPLFGGATQQTPAFGQQQSTGLFGAQPLGQTTAGGGLFGQQPAAGGGLFGGGAQQQQPTLGLGATGQNTGLGLGATGSGGSSLFGGPKPAGTSLFGGQQAQTQPAAGGLFGASAQPAGGLFGNSAQPGGGTSLFGAKPLGATQSQTTPSLFGQQQPGSSLFGGQTQTPAFGGGSSLFGGQQQTQPQGGMFSLTGQQQQQPGAAPGPGTGQPVYNPYGDASKLADPYGGKTSYLTTVSPFDNAEDEIKKLQDEIYLNKSSSSREDPYKDITPLDRFRGGFSSINTPSGAEEEYVQQQPEPSYLPSADEKRASLNDSLAEKYKRAYNQQPVSQEGKFIRVFNAQGYTQSKANANFRPQKTFGTDSSFQLSRQTSMHQEMKSPEPAYQSQQQAYEVSQNSDKKIFKPDGGIVRQTTNFLQPQPSQAMVSNPDILALEIAYPDHPHGLFQAKQETIKIHRSRDVIEVYNKVKKMLKDEGRWTNDILDIKLLYKNALLNDKLSLKDAGIHRASRLSIIYDMVPQQVKEVERLSISVESEISYTPTSIRNTLGEPKEGYITNPPFEILSYISEKSLSQVKNFSIKNEFGYIQFDGLTDLTNVDLADLVEITFAQAEVYDEVRHAKIYPQLGEKLNRPATVTYYGIDPKRDTIEKKRSYLEKAAQGMNAQHVAYDNNKKEWTIRVAHWTKYKLIDIDEEEQSNEQEQFNPSPIINQELSEDNNQNQSMSMDVDDLQQVIARQGGVKQPFIMSNTFQYQKQQQQPPIILGQGAFTKPIQQEQVRRRRNNPPGDLEILSSASSQHYENDQDMIEINTSQKSIVERGTADFKVLRAEEIRLTIEKRDAEFANVKKLYRPKKSLQDCLKYLKNKVGVEVKEQGGVIQGFKNMPSKVHRFRPQFKGDGTLLTLKKNTNELKLTEIRVVPDSTNSEQKRVYSSIGEVLKNHMKISDSDVSQQLSNMSLSQAQMAQGDALVDPNLRALAQNREQNQVGVFEDTQLQHMLSSSHLPSVEFKQSPSELFYFYEELALTLLQKMTLKDISTMTRQKLNQEFYVVCTLNALFGNPNIHLIQKHSQFQNGINNYDRARDKFTREGEFIDGASMQNDKKRKNALTEVIRFICQQEHPVKAQNGNDDLIYQGALAYLLNGDVKRAVTHLNASQKRQMASHVINCFANPSNKASIREYMQMISVQGSKFNKSAKVLVSYMMGEMSKDFNATWIQALCFHLMVRADPSETLQEAIQGFFRDIYSQTYQNQQQDTPLLWVLIQFYGMSQSHPDVLERLNNFSKVQLYKNPLVQEHRLPFLITLSIHNFLIHHQLNAYNYANQFRSMRVTFESMKNSTINYLNQLMREGDWEQALLVSSFIPPSFNKLRKQVVFSILQKKAPFMLKNDSDRQSKSQALIFKTLGIPICYALSARAMIHQSTSNYESAIHDWKNSGIINQSHRLFIKYLAVGALLKGSLEPLSQLVRELDLENQKIFNWREEGSILKNYLMLLMKSVKDENHIKDLSKTLLHVSNSSQTSPSQINLIQRYIWEKLLNWDKTRALQNWDDLNKDSHQIAETIVSAYPEGHQLARVYEELAIQYSTQIECIRQVQKSPYKNLMEIN